MIFSFLVMLNFFSSWFLERLTKQEMGVSLLDVVPLVEVNVSEPPSGNGRVNARLMEGGSKSARECGYNQRRRRDGAWQQNLFL